MDKQNVLTIISTMHVFSSISLVNNNLTLNNTKQYNLNKPSTYYRCRMKCPITRHMF